MILDVNTLSNEAGKCTETEAIKMNLSELIMFNSFKKKRRSSDNVEHPKTSEPTFPVKIGLLIHSVTRKKSLINKLANDGLSINHQGNSRRYNSISLHEVEQRSISMSTTIKTRTIHYNSYR